MKKIIPIFALMALFTGQAFAESCQQHFTKAQLTQLKAADFDIESDQQRNQTAINLLSCIGHKAPSIRDGVVYEASAKWLRQELLTTATINTMFKQLITRLKQKSTNENSLTQAFSALVLSEVVRVDRISPYLTEKQRQLVVDVATNYMQLINDYRGFDDSEGWRHHVAHTADIFLQLALNKRITKAQLEQMLLAINSQVSPKKHFYHYSEPKRLAMPMIYIALRDEFSVDEINRYLEYLANPAPFDSWQVVYSSNAGLSKLHNIRSFIYSFYVLTSKSENKKLISIRPSLEKIIQQLG